MDVSRRRFYVQYDFRVSGVYDGSTERCLLALGPPRGDVLASVVCRRLNELGELGRQTVALDGEYAFDKLALKYLNEVVLESDT